MKQTALQKAIEIAGGQKPLADKIGTTQSMVWYWLRAKRGLPPERALQVEGVTGVSRHLLRPDIFGPAPEQRRAGR